MKREYIELIIQILFILEFILLFYIILSNYYYFVTNPCVICEEKEGKNCLIDQTPSFQKYFETLPGQYPEN